ncbi:MAG: hypothetical protein Ct9H300mP31_21330 [Acidimicrobiaceae bacterium]|nr:MAG: hypothetical protein Ct9H300mP31_21330 [Acidimicrobiaceae bacterium]
MGTEVVDGEGATVDGDRTRTGTVVGTAVAGVIAMLATRSDNASSWVSQLPNFNLQPFSLCRIATTQTAHHKQNGDKT